MQHIYALTFLPTGRVYIGQTASHRLAVRFDEHTYAMARNDHFNEHLQASWTGKFSDWGFQVLETSNAAACTVNRIEREWIAAFPDVFNIRHAKTISIPHTIDDATRAEVLKRLGTGLTGKVVAKQMGISSASVSLIKNGQHTSKFNERVAAHFAELKAVKAKRLARIFDVAMEEPVLYSTGRVYIRATAKKHGIAMERLYDFGLYLKERNLMDAVDD